MCLAGAKHIELGHKWLLKEGNLLVWVFFGCIVWCVIG